MRSVSFSSVLNPKLLFSSEKSRNVEKSLFNINLEVPSSCSEKSENISSTKSSNEFMSRETLVDKLEQPSNVFCTGKYCKYNINTSQQSTDTLQKLNSDLSKVSGLPLSALEKTVTATVSCCNLNPEFLSSCSDKSVIAISTSSLNYGKSFTDSNLNTAGESCGVGALSTCNRYDVATYRSKAPFISDIEKKDLIENVFVPDDNFSFPETNRSLKSEWFKWFPLLCYSPSEDAVYCLACVLFGYKFPEKASRVKNFYSQPFRHWPAAVSAC